MRFGGPVFGDNPDPDAWVKKLRASGYTAAYCPVDADAPDGVVADYERAARDSDIVVAEVGAWSNPIGPDREASAEAVLRCKKQLELAEKIGARCCVNISGSRGSKWDGPHADNLTDETFGMIVDSVRDIIDAVRPERTYYTLETMPWAYPDSADSYLKLIQAVNRRQFAAHFDPVNIISSPWAYYHSDLIIKEYFTKLGKYIKSCHAKDISLADRLTVHLDEAPPGQGNLCYKTYISELKRIGPDTPLMLEHLSTEEEYTRAAAFVKELI